MSSLQQSLHRRREELTEASCITAAAQAPALVVCAWKGEKWVLPWSHFVSARLGADADRLELAFTNCMVLVTGENLAGLVEDLAAFRIGGLRELPTTYRKQIAEGEPFITRIEVRASGEAGPHTNRELSR